MAIRNVSVKLDVVTTVTTYIPQNSVSYGLPRM